MCCQSPEQKKYCRQLGWVCAFLIPLGLIIGGVVCVAIGADKTETANQMNPEEDFKGVAGKCQITRHTHKEWETTEERDHNGRKHRVTICHDRITWYFTKVGEGQEYAARNLDSERCEDCYCSTSGHQLDLFVKLRKFSSNEVTKCWEPAIGTDALPGGYRCGNKEACVKIFDPADDKAALAEEGKVLSIVGGVLLGVGIITAVTMAICAKYCKCGQSQSRAKVQVTTPTQQPGLFAQLQTQEQVQPMPIADAVVQPMMQVTCVVPNPWVPVVAISHPTTGTLTQVQVPQGLVPGQQFMAMV